MTGSSVDIIVYLRIEGDAVKKLTTLKEVIDYSLSTGAEVDWEAVSS